LQYLGEMNYSAELGYNQGLNTQVEMDRLERKRERNRVAANKCRLRKLERISQLDKEVNKLKEENSELALVRQKLVEEARDLREMLKKHLDCGCLIGSDIAGLTTRDTSFIF